MLHQIIFQMENQASELVWNAGNFPFSLSNRKIEDWSWKKILLIKPLNRLQRQNDFLWLRNLNLLCLLFSARSTNLNMYRHCKTNESVWTWTRRMNLPDDFRQTLIKKMNRCRCALDVVVWYEYWIVRNWIVRHFLLSIDITFHLFAFFCQQLFSSSSSSSHT